MYMNCLARTNTNAIYYDATCCKTDFRLENFETNELTFIFAYLKSVFIV